MKNLSTLTRTIRRFILGVALACPFAVGCTTFEQYDDSEIKEQIDLIINKIYELEQKMNSEIQALKDMLAGKIMITSISTNTSTGVTTVKLSNGSSFELLPEKDLKSFVTYITLSDGIAYWAYIDEDGKKQLFLDANGEAIPVLADVPEVIVKDGETWIVIGGVEYPLSGNSVFSDYELITDDLTGEVYAVTFTFGEDMSFTVTVDGACGFFFVKPSGWSTVAITDYYVANGLTERVQIDARGVVDYVLQIPDGWRVKEYEDVYMGALYFDITAPSKELVESGVAAADGDLKVVAVLEGGKATVAKLDLSTTPFKEFSVSLGKADVKMYNGLQKYVYGVCQASKFDEASILSTAEGLLTAFDYPAGYGVCDYDLEGVSVEEIAGQALTAGTKYMLWAIPALYYYTDEDSGYYLKEGTFVKKEFSFSSVKFEVGKESILDAQLSMDLKGVKAYYTALLPKADFMIEDVVYNLNNPGYYTAKKSPMTYEGSVFEFAGVEAEQATEYVAWIAVAEEDKVYTEADVVVCEFSTLNLLPGSDVKLTVTDPVTNPSDVEIKVTAAGAKKIYYTYKASSALSNLDLKDNEKVAFYLFENGTVVDGAEVTAKASDLIELKPDTEYVFMALATDADGKYSEPVTKVCRTDAITYNDLVVNLAIDRNEPGNVVVAISAEGAVDYLYWIGRTADNVWKSPSYLGGSAAKAQQYMYANAGHERFANIKEAYPVVDGKITMTDLTAGANYVIVAMAKDKDGLYSEAVELKFTPRTVAIGNVVYATDPRWEAARPNVEWMADQFRSSSGMMSGQYSFKVTIPEGYTGYVLAGTEDYITEGNSSLKLSAEDRLIKVIEYADHVRDLDVTVDENLWLKKGYPYGFEFYHYEHGAPVYGYGVLWANEEFHASRCDCEHTALTERTWYEGTDKEVTMPINIVVLYNDGTPVEFRQPQAIGSTTEVVDKVFIVCQDLEGNCYEAFEYPVPLELFVNAPSGR